MAAIITDHFRRNQARLLVNDIKASADAEFDSTANSSSNSNETNWPYRGNNRYSVGLGKSDSWPNNAGGVNEGAANFVVPVPTGIRQEDEDVINNLFTLKDVVGGSAKQMIAKNTWTSGRKYKVYDSADPDAFYATGDLYPCYATHGNSVYIVLSNTAVNNGFTSVAASTTAPAASSAGDYSFSNPAQGYVWCEVAKLDSNDDLITNQFVPIPVTPTVTAVQRKRTAGLLSHVGVVSGGTGYTSETTITATIVKHSGAIVTPDITFKPIISSGVIQRVDIRDANNNPTEAGSYDFWVTANAADDALTSMIGSSVTIPNRIKSINFVINDPGSSSESSESGGTGAQLSGTIAPSTGYAKNAIDVLPTWFVGINVDFEGLETDSDAPALKFRQVSLLKNFIRSTDADESSGSESFGTLGALKSITLHTPQASAIGNLLQGQILYQQTSGAKFYFDHYHAGTSRLYYHQNSDGEINQIGLVANNSHGIGTALNGSQVSAGVAALITPEYQSRIVTSTTDGTTDHGEFNGEVIFHENRKSFSRSSTQTEEVKLIIQL